MLLRFGSQAGAISSWKLQKWLPGILAVIAGFVGTSLALAQEPILQKDQKPGTQMPTPALPGQIVPPRNSTAPPEKMVTVNFVKAPWANVLDWFRDESGLTPVLTYQPTGSVTIQSPKDQKLTISEVVDLLNDAMMQQKFVLIRRNVSFFIHPSDEKIDPTFVPRIELSELGSRGQTEIVQVLIPLKTLTVEDAVPELRNLLSNFGSISSLAKTNTLVITDAARNIRRVYEMIQQVEQKGEDGETYFHKCRYKKAQEVAEALKTHLADSTITNNNPTGGAGAPGGGFFPNNFGGMPGGFDASRFGIPGGMGGENRGDGRDGGGGPNNGGRRGGPGGSARTTKTATTITFDAKANTITVVGPPDKIQLAKNLVEGSLDKGDTPITLSDPVLKKYSVPTGTADAVARTLQGTNPLLKILSLPGTNEILVLATEEEHKGIVSQIAFDKQAQAAIIQQVIPVISDPTEMATKLTSMYPATGGGPTITAQIGQQGVVVIGTIDQIGRVQATIHALEGTTASGAGVGIRGPNQRVIGIPDGSTVILAQKLAQLMAEMGKNPVQVIGPDGLPIKPAPSLTNPLTPPYSGGAGGGSTPPSTPLPLPPGKQGLAPTKSDIQNISAQLVDPNQPKSQKKPVTIEVRGKQLIITSDDPDALDLLAHLASYYTSSKANDNLFKVIRLKNVVAEDAAKTITEIFNGPQQSQQQQRPGGFGGGPFGFMNAMMGGANQPAPTINSGRIRVVAEKSSNSLVVIKASPIDLLTIENLVSEYVDRGVTEDSVTMRWFAVPVKYADATEIADRVKALFRTLTTVTRTTPETPVPFAPPQAQISTKPPQLTVDVDDRTNKLLLYCTEETYKQIEAFVRSELDTPDVANPEAIKVVQLNGIDPALVQQAIDAFQGRNPLAAQQRGGLGGGLGGFGNGMGGFAGRGGMGGGGFGGMGGGGFGGMGGGGFGGMGGGGFGGPAMGGGGLGGGMGGGGRGAGGGGGGRGGRGGTGRQANAGGTEGPLNFDYRGMDAPLAPVSYTLYDPMIEGTEPSPNNTFHVENRAGILPIYGQFQLPTTAQPLSLGQAVPAFGSGIHRLDGQFQSPIAAQPPMPRPLPPGEPVPPPGYGTAPPGTVAPRGIVTAYSLQGLDALVIRAESEADLKIILEMIEALREISKAAQPRLEVIQLEYVDCNVAADFLTQLFSRVVIMGPGGVYAAPMTQQPGFGAFGGGALGAAQQAQNKGFYFLAMPQLNSLLVVGPQARFDDIRREIRRIDVPTSEYARPKPFRLKRASAQIVATQLQTFFNTRFPGQPQTKTQFRVTYDSASNTVWVQGSRADLEDVALLIEDWDTTESAAINDVRIFKLRNADAQGLAQVLTNALSVNVVNPLQQATFAGPVVQTAGGTSNLGATTPFGGAAGGLPAGGPAGLPAGGPAAGLAGLAGAGQSTNIQVTSTLPTVGAESQGGLVTRSNTLRFIYGDREGSTAIVTSGLLSDVHLVPNVRTNAIIVSAPEKTMNLIEKLIDQLDTAAAAAAFVQIYTLKNADANLTATLLRSLFTGQTTTGTGGGGGGGGGGGAAGGTTGANNQTTLTRPLLVEPGGDIFPGATLISLQIAVDDRTNSLIVAGAQNDLITIRGIIAKLEAADTPDRFFDVYKLRNSAAADVANALTSFIGTALSTYSSGNTANFATSYLWVQKNVVIVAEPVSNTVLISATPFYFMEMKRLIERIDAQPPQVVIQVLIASVQLTNDEEFGVEFGLQSPVLFQRGLLPTPTPTSTTATNAASPGYLFNTTSSATPSGNLGNSAVASPGAVGFQSLSNLGVGTSSPTQGIGGFVFQASSQSLSILVRALQAQGRIDILSRPQVTVADNQTGYVQVGANYPYLSASTLTGVGTAQQSVAYEPIGVTMRVTPRVNPDGKVLMRVEPQVANVSAAPISLGNGIEAPAFNIQTVQTTVLASSGETIVLGGLISKQDTRSEAGVPFFKDIPYIGTLFRYRQHAVNRQEVLVIMTPHIVRSEIDSARVLAEESSRMHSCFQDYARLHGHGMEVIGPAALGARVVPTNTMAPGGGFFGAPPVGSPINSGPVYIGDMQSSLQGDVPPGMAPRSNASIQQQPPYSQQPSQYYQAPNGQPVYYNPPTVPGPANQPMYSPGAQAPVTQPMYSPGAQAPVTQPMYSPGAQAPVGQPAYSQPIYTPGVPQVPISQPIHTPSVPQAPAGQPMNSDLGSLPQISIPQMPVTQPGAMMQPGMVPGASLQQGSPTAAGFTGHTDWPATSQPAQSIPMAPLAQTSGAYPAQPTYGGPPTGSVPPVGSTYRMEMPNVPPVPPASMSPRLPEMPQGISDPNFMRMQQQQMQQQQMQQQQTVTAPPTNRNSDLPQVISGQNFMQPQLQPSGSGNTPPWDR